MSKKVGHIGDPNAVRGPDQPETAFRATAGFDEPRPRHHLQNLGGLGRREVGCGRDLVSLQRLFRNRQAAESLERFINARRKITTEHDEILYFRSSLSESVNIRSVNSVTSLSDLRHVRPIG